MNPRNCLVEFIGTFFLVFVIGLTVVPPAAGVSVPDAGPMAPIAIGLALVVLVYWGGHLSGAHYNPAVTLGVFLRGKCKFADVIPYMVVQFVAGILAGLLVNYLKGTVIPPTIPPFHDITKGMLNEFIFTFLLVSTILSVATTKKIAGNQFYGIAIGFTVTAAAYAGGGISGGAYNPAVATGATAMGLSALANIWMFLVPQFLAAIVAAIFYRIVNPDEA